MSLLPTIRPTALAEHPALVALAEGTGKFKPTEIVALAEVLHDYEATQRAAGHHCVTWWRGEQPLGFAYFAPAAMTERTWYLYWIAVSASEQGRGIGGELLRHVEQEVQRHGGGQLLIETSGLPHYEPTRQFYLRHQYERHAVIADYYADGDDMVVFRKRLP